MILALVFVVQQDASGAPIGAEGDATGTTCLPRILDFLTMFTLDRLDRMTIHCVCFFAIGFVLVLGLVVAEATGEKRSATGGQKNGLAFVMLAPFVVLRHLSLSFDHFI
jgi:hypothetical protein